MICDDELRQKLTAILKKSQRSLVAAKRNLAEGDFDFAVSRAYYAAFYALEALLLTKEMTFSKHAGVIGAFNKYFVKEGLFPPDTTRQINLLFQDRQTGDYAFEKMISRSDAERDLEATRSLVEQVERHLRNGGWVPGFFSNHG